VVNINYLFSAAKNGLVEYAERSDCFIQVSALAGDLGIALTKNMLQIIAKKISRIFFSASFS